MKKIMIALLLLASSAYGQTNQYTDRQDFEFSFLGKNYAPFIEWDDYERMVCEHETRYWTGKDLIKSPCNWSAKIVRQLEKDFYKPYKDNPTFVKLLETFTASIPLEDTDGQTPWETLVYKYGSVTDHKAVMDSLLYYAQKEPQVEVAKPYVKNTSCSDQNEEWSDRLDKCVCKRGYYRSSTTGRCTKESPDRH